MRRNLILFILTLVCSSGAWAQMNFISEVKISAEEGQSTNKERLRNDGYTVIDQDLNQDAGGRYIYIGYKTTTDASQAISGLIVVESSSSVDVRSSYYKTHPITYRDKNYYRCDSYGSNDDNCDLNRKAGGADITLYYTKDGNTDHGAMLLTELTAVVNDKNMAGYSYIRHWQYGTDMYSTSDADVYGDANKGTGDDPIYFPCKYHTHNYTAIFNWADDGHSCSVTTRCACGDGSTGDATITSEVKTPATYRVNGITTYTAKITLNNKEFTDTKDVQDIVMPLDEVKTVVKGMIDDMVAQEKRADMSALGSDYKAQVDAAATREDVWAIIDAFPAALDAAAALVLAQAKEAAIVEIETALGDITDATLLATIQGYKDQIGAAMDIWTVSSAKVNALTSISAYKDKQERLRLLEEAKAAAIAEIETALGDITDATLLATIQGYIDQINAVVFISAIAPIKANALATIDAYKAEQERLRLLEEAKEAAIASIQALVSGSTDELAISTADKYIALIEAAMVIEDVAPLRSEAERIIGRLLTEPDALTFGFIGTGNPTETQHALEGVKMTYSADGEQMIVTINGKAVTYPLSQVSELTYFQGTPAITLSTSQNPNNESEYVTTFHSGLEAYAIPEGVRAYTAEVNAAQTAVILMAIEGGVLPQGEAVLLYTDVAGVITMNTVVSSVAASETNQLRGTDVRDKTPANCMALNSTAGAFQHYTGEFFPANKAYLLSNAPAPLRIGFSAGQTDTATGMETDSEQIKAQKVLRNGQLFILREGRVFDANGVELR